MEKFSYLKSANADYIDELLERYSANPDSVDESWKYFFEGLEIGTQNPSPVSNGYSNGNGNGHAAPTKAAPPTAPTGLNLADEAKVAELIVTYRHRGRLQASINPLDSAPAAHPDLALSNFGLTDADLSRTFQTGKLVGIGPAKLSDIITHLKKTYCGSLGVEIEHIENKEARHWLETKLESSAGRDPELTNETRKFILKRLTASETFERFLHTRYVAQKRFSVEGGESCVPAIDCMIETGAELGAREFAMGMAHRGRLNILTNVFGKKASDIFTEFEGNYKLDTSHGEGDVKYHKGYSRDFTTRKGKAVHLSLASNPSHLEFINPVVEGVARAKIDRLGDNAQVMPILIHGDAAFAGQGICYETLGLSQLEGYKTGGTIHLVINNQVGFTADPWQSRSTTYCTDMAKMLDSPIIHVNGDDPEAVWYASRLVTEYRQKFKADVFIDLICYRKYGHNESDEPAFTQPLLYKKIKTHPSTREIYAQALAQGGAVSATDSQAMIDEITAVFTADHQTAKNQKELAHASVFEREWKGFRQPANDEEMFAPVKTAVEEATLKALSLQINTLPQGFHPHPKLVRLFEGRHKAVTDGKGIDWGNGEILTFASILNEGRIVRLSGQDAERGTFTHRHSVLHDFETGEKYTPLHGIKAARYAVYNSHLSEAGVLGFEYGYSLAAPKALTIWEAQFGDFANGAQVIIDQFISSSESKWQRMSGIVLLLPHGYEGQGPEHSSARLERYLSMCGKQNMQVCNLTNPAQLFHAFRRQVLRDFRKPLIIMSPKSLLRHPLAVSNLTDFTTGGFEEVLNDPIAAANPAGIKRVVFCSGKVYYDLLNERTTRKADHVALVRIEQLYPWPAKKLAAILAQYPQAKDLVWAQEEPRNMGAWTFVFGMWCGTYENFQAQVGNRPIRYVGREVCAAPAVGSIKLHEQEQKALLEKAFTD